MSEDTRASGSATRCWSTGLAPALAAAALLVGASGPATAAEPELKLDHVWAGCELDQATVSALSADLADSGIEDEEGGPNPEIAFVLVYSLNDNDGQPAVVGEDEGMTGPVLCLNKNLNVGAGNELTIDTTDQTTNIPESGTANFLDVEDVFIVRYQLDDESGDIEKVLCHTVKGNSDCFRIFPEEVPD